MGSGNAVKWCVVNRGNIDCGRCCIADSAISIGQRELHTAAGPGGNVRDILIGDVSRKGLSGRNICTTIEHYLQWREAIAAAGETSDHDCAGSKVVGNVATRDADLADARTLVADCQSVVVRAVLAYEYR